MFNELKELRQYIRNQFHHYNEVKKNTEFLYKKKGPDMQLDIDWQRADASMIVLENIADRLDVILDEIDSNCKEGERIISQYRSMYPEMLKYVGVEEIEKYGVRSTTKTISFVDLLNQEMNELMKSLGINSVEEKKNDEN